MFEVVRHAVSPKFRRAERVLARRYLGRDLKIGVKLAEPFSKWSGPGYSTRYLDPRVKEIKKYGVVVEGGPYAFILTIGEDIGGKPYQRKFPTQATATKFIPFRELEPVYSKLQALLHKQK
ncbi:hypothetical protein COU15_02895 [Candidatus Kaiserbacteria bacterium CG10_big_fil_rev_8_21_14_0_10_45_20]|uniref:Uncharacterized protein n=1 Tax=Candidatus Kaiserbacteria bacterium CG10_big_fil_rev_8_21_14_0_10_45_20 TaxID=1974607 RepID=A0A2H0UF41_9BACT|nr:MAG: hypothetical protein COU15_02895 [Candidatus Kaiserbacteria bacterium CG10_big_fil_rev_8_21_14_0_10_45_20]